MANYPVTGANIRQTSTSKVVGSLVAGEAIAAGEWYYQAADKKHYLADCTTSTKAKVKGQALTAADGVDSTFTGIEGGEHKPGATLVKGDDIVLSATAGKMCPRADLNTGKYITRLGTAKDTGTMRMSIDATGIQL